MNCNTIPDWINKFEKMAINDKQKLKDINKAMQRMMLDTDMYREFPEVHAVWEISNRVIRTMD